MSLVRQIRVVQFLNGAVRAGAEEVALELARGLDRTRFRSYLVCPQPLLDAFGDDCKEHSTMALPMSLDAPWQWPQAQRFVKFLRSEAIDIVHAHMIRAALAAVPLARLAGVPVVVHTCHGREAWRTSWLKRRYGVDRLISTWSDATVAVSESTAVYLTKTKGISPRKIRLIRNGRRIDGFHRLNLALKQRLRSELGILPGDQVVGVFGRLDEQKGHRFLLEALPAVLRKISALKVLFVGDGVLREALQNDVQSKGLDSCVIFTGYRRDCVQLMEICDLIALPSLYEGMPLVPIEAAALGKPVLATAVDGTREVVADGVTGVLVPPGHSSALVQALTEMLVNPDRRLALGEQARIRARQLFSLDRQLQETESLYTDLLSRFAAGRRGHGRLDSFRCSPSPAPR